MSELLRTPLWSLHHELGAKMAPFGGWDMPLRYSGTVAEHKATRTSAGLFDVAHLGVVDVSGADVSQLAAWLEGLVPAGISGLEAGQMTYTMLTTPTGGVIDDVVVSNLGDRLRVAVNASNRDVDLAHLQAAAGNDGPTVTFRHDLATIALQGPEAEAVLAGSGFDADLLADMTFMQCVTISPGEGSAALLGGATVDVARAGYTGEDGFELTVAADAAELLASVLLADDRVTPAGLGARDTLRLEAGLCLHGSDLDDTISPIEAGLVWSIPKARRHAEAGYPGAATIAQQIAEGPARRRVGIAATCRRPIRAGAQLFPPDGDAGDPAAAAAAETATPTDNSVGWITSGTFSPTLERPVAMGYVATEHAAAGSQLVAVLDGRAQECEVAKLPFVTHNYKRR